jgi:AsmA protein
MKMKIKKPLIIAGAIVAVLLLIVLCLPLLINANQFKPTIETKLNAALGRNVTIGDISRSPGIHDFPYNR